MAEVTVSSIRHEVRDGLSAVSSAVGVVSGSLAGRSGLTRDEQTERLNAAKAAITEFAKQVDAFATAAGERLDEAVALVAERKDVVPLFDFAAFQAALAPKSDDEGTIEDALA